MAAPQLSTKRLAISKANAQMVGIVAGAAFVTVFCLVASHSLWSQTRYQSKVVSAKAKANSQLKKNIAAFNSLQSAYQAFDNTPTNIIGGTLDGSGDNDGSNSKIILDALPYKYDFPALTSSIEKILTDRQFHVASIGGTDDQLAQQGNTSSATPQPVTIPFTFTINHANYRGVQQLIGTLQKSIRPIAIDKITLTGGANDMTLSVDAHTYYQPAKNLTITKQAIK